MQRKTLWLNTHFNCIPSIRDSDVEGEFCIVTSYTSYKYAHVLLADAFELEPKTADGDYVDFCLDFVQRHDVDVFLPGRRIDEIVSRVDEFTALGVKVILVADAQTLALLDDKGLFYAAVAHCGVPIPDHRIAGSVSDFVSACSELQARHDVVCYKPTIGIFGYGFKVLETAPRAELPLDIDRSLVIAEHDAAAHFREKLKFKPQMVMEYLPGIERSVDCFAVDGRLVRCVVRSKLPDGSRVLEGHALIEEHTRRLVSELRLNGLFNVQFKDMDGVPYLLEINARMSGGVVMSCLSGFSFPYWAAKAALGEVADETALPQPRLGIRVAEMLMPVVL